MTVRMLVRITCCIAAAALGACGGSPTNLPLTSPTPGVALDTVATGLQVPWDMAFAPDGRIFVTERAGRIRVIENGVLRTEPWAVLPVARRSEMGLMGIALAPDFAVSGNLFVVGAFAAGEKHTGEPCLPADGAGWARRGAAGHPGRHPRRPLRDQRVGRRAGLVTGRERERKSAEQECGCFRK